MHHLSDFLCLFKHCSKLKIIKQKIASLKIRKHCIVKTSHRIGIAHPYTGVIKAKCHYYVFQHTRGLRHFYSPVFIMRLLSAVLVLLNIAYHDTCGGGRLCRTGAFCIQYGNRVLAQMGPMGQMGQIGRMGQMGQMLRRNGNVFQMLPIKEMGKCGNFAKTVGEVSPKSHLHFFYCFYRRNCHKMVIKNGQIG